MNRKKWTKAALAFSACLFVLWWILGTSATLAWFSDTDTLRNKFQIGLLNIDVSYSHDIGAGYSTLEGETRVFDDEALYEPGYTQVVYLEIENKGNVEFDYKVAVTVEDFENGTNAWNEDIYLPDYLCYGVVFAKSENELQQKVKDRLKAKDQAPNIWSALGTWSEVSPYTYELEDDPHYAALIIHMPEDIGNRANYCGLKEPKVILGVTVFAQQADTGIQ